MKEKDLKHLNREELLELLLVQTKENEKLSQKLKEAEEQLAERRIKIENCGTLAQAVAEINGIMEAAQKTAEQYLENISMLENETREKCRKILEDAEYEAGIIRKSKKKDAVANAILEEIRDFVDEKQ